VTRRLLDSTVGQAFLAIRENEELASSVGIATFRIKLVAFVIGMVFTGMAGSIYARYVQFVDPTALSFYITGTVVRMVIVGGQGGRHDARRRALHPAARVSARRGARAARDLRCAPDVGDGVHARGAAGPVAALAAEADAVTTLLEVKNLAVRFGGLTAVDGV